MKYILRIYKSIFKWAPFSAAITALEYLNGAIVPAVITAISVNFFDSAARILGGAAGDSMAGGTAAARGELYLCAGLYLGIYLVHDLFILVRSVVLNAGIYEKGTAFFRIELYEKLARLPLTVYEDAELLNRKERAEKAVNDETLSAIFNHSMRFIRAGVQVVSVAVVLAGYSPWLLPLSALSVLPYLVARAVRGKEFFYVKQHQAKKTRLLSYLWELFSERRAAREMRVAGFDAYLAGKWSGVRDEVNEELWAVQKKDALSLLLCDGFRIAGYGISVLAVLLLALRGHVSVGVFGAAVAAFLGLQNSMQNFLIGLGSFPEQLAHAADYYAFLDMPAEPDGVLVYPGLRDAITLEDVSFTYPNGAERALKSLSLTIRRGEKIAILGENGSGKTTLSKVLLGLYPPQSGRVLYDGAPVSDYTKESFYARVSAIAQDFVRYSLTLRENIAISDLARLSDAQSVRDALGESGAGAGNGVGVGLGAGVNACTDIGLDEMLGREFGGRELSGGQWQKLAIARGLFKNSELIVLDEPTSALDPLIETEILTRFIEAANQKTALIISHRVGLCKLVDRVVVMRGGRVVEDGTHDALLAAGGEYARLYGEQARWYHGE